MTDLDRLAESLRAQYARLDDEISALENARAHYADIWLVSGGVRVTGLGDSFNRWVATSTCAPTFYAGVHEPARACDGCGASHRVYHRKRLREVCAYCGRDI